MPEHTMLTPEQISALQTEVETLRKTNAELLTKRQKDKTRIAELETSTTELQSKLTVSETALHDVTVGAPLKAMSEDVSPVPELFRDQLLKHFRVELLDGKVALQSADGKPVTDKDGKPIPFERMALTKFLTDGEDARAKTFAAITRTSWASGAQSVTEPTRRTAAPSKPRAQFGLR